MMYRFKRPGFLIVFLVLFLFRPAMAAFILVPMDEAQKNHLKAYGIAYWVLKKDVEVSWLLNYRGGSFMFQYVKAIEEECTIRGVTCQIIADAQAAAILPNILPAAQEMTRWQSSPKHRSHARIDSLSRTGTVPNAGSTTRTPHTARATARRNRKAGAMGNKATGALALCRSTCPACGLVYASPSGAGYYRISQGQAEFVPWHCPQCHRETSSQEQHGRSNAATGTDQRSGRDRSSL